jgi:hypothetical protein
VNVKWLLGIFTERIVSSCTRVESEELVELYDSKHCKFTSTYGYGLGRKILLCALARVYLESSSLKNILPAPGSFGRMHVVHNS